MKKVIISGCILLGLAGCYNDKYDQLYPAPVTNGTTNTCDTTNVSYTTTIQPLIASSCVLSGCHDGSTRSAHNFSTYTQLIVDTSTLVSYVDGTNSDRMPKNGAPLTTCNISKISAWIKQGAKNN